MSYLLVGIVAIVNKVEQIARLAFEDAANLPQIGYRRLKLPF